MGSRYTVHFTGHVQGVGFRWTAVRVARSFKVAGYVQNLSDGRVKLVAEGEPADLDRFIAAVIDAMRDNITDQTNERGNATGEFGKPAPGALQVKR